LVVLNKIKDNEMESFMTARLAEEGIRPIGIIHEDPSIAMSWLIGISLNGTKTKRDTERIVEKLKAAEKAYPADLP
jgi:CO dehydrogenase nickel-insertion accessory protein CooC1